MFWVLLRSRSACRGHNTHPSTNKKKNTINFLSICESKCGFYSSSCSSGQTDFSCTTTTKHCVLINAEHRETRHPDKILLAISNINDNVTGGMWFIWWLFITSVCLQNYCLCLKVFSAHHWFDQKYSKNSNIVKYYYNLKSLFYIWIYCQM